MIDSAHPQCHTATWVQFAQATEMLWAFPRNSTAIFLANSEKVAHELERAKYHEELSFQAVISRVMMAHYRDLAQLAKAAKLVSGHLA